MFRGAELLNYANSSHLNLGLGSPLPLCVKVSSLQVSVDLQLQLSFLDRLERNLPHFLT